MIIWLDAQLPPTVAAWITATFAIEARAVRDLGLRDAKDPSIFQAARAAEADSGCSNNSAPLTSMVGGVFHYGLGHEVSRTFSSGLRRV